MTDFNNNSNIIDSRDILERIEEIETEIEEIETEIEGAQSVSNVAYIDSFNKELEDDPTYLDLKEELKILQELIDDIGSGAGDGVTLINEDHFTEYAESYANDIGAIDSQTAVWPANYIDWEQAADELRIDFSDVDYDGETFYYRN